MIKIYLRKIIKLKKIILLVLIFISFEVYSSTAVKFSDRIEVYSLPNKLKVILLEDKRNPIAISSIWYKVGSSYEIKGKTGISHVLEHMMFKGTQKIKAGEFSKIIKKFGGSENAFTGRDFTGYYQKVNKIYLEKCLEMEADRMSNLVLKQSDFEKELNVVKEERRLRVDDRPIPKAFEKILQQAFGYNEYGIPIIGTMDDLSNLELDDLQSWYKKFYTPENATLIIAGDIDKVGVKQLIEKYFLPIKNKDFTAKIDQLDNHKTNFDDIILKDSISNPTILISFIQPKFNRDDRLEHYKIDLLLELMDGGSSSRLTKNLVDKKKVALETFISSDTYPMKKNIIAIGAIPRKNISIETLRDEIFLQFKDIVEKGITDKEFESLKSRLSANSIFKLDSLFGQVMRIGILESKKIGWETLDYYIDDMNKITKNDLIDTAKKYFIDRDFIFTVIHPNTT